MKKNEKGVFCRDALDKNLTNELTVKTPNKELQMDNTPTRNKIQLKLTSFVCDECALPLRLYGQNFIETYTGGKVNVLRCLCDLHAAEMEVA